MRINLNMTRIMVAIAVALSTPWVIAKDTADSSTKEAGSKLTKEGSSRPAKEGSSKPTKETTNKTTKEASSKPAKNSPEKKVDLMPKDSRSSAQKTFDANKVNADKVSKELAKAKETEAMRDKTHDNRLKVGPNTSVGGNVNPPEVNIKKTIP